MTRDELKGKIAGVIADARNEGYDDCLTMDLDEAVDSILSLIDAERCVWTLNGEDWITQCGADIPDEDTYEKYPYCPRCGKRISIKEDKNV